MNEGAANISSSNAFFHMLACQYSHMITAAVMTIETPNHKSRAHSRSATIPMPQIKAGSLA
jgi:hypothetical protein